MESNRSHRWNLDASSQLSVLIVEDDAALRRLVAHALKNRRFHVVECSTYAEADAAIQRFEIDLAVVDLSLPDASGSLVLRKLANHRPSTKVLVFTSNSNLASAVEAIKLKVFAFVEKSLGIHHLIDQIELASVAYLRDALAASRLESCLQMRLLDAIDEAAIATDIKFKLLFANRFARDLFGLAELPFIGVNVDRFVSITDAKGIRQRRTTVEMLRVLRMGECWSREVYLSCYYGLEPISKSTFPAKIRVTPIFGSESAVQGFIAVFSSIQQERHLRFALHEQRDRILKNGRLVEENRLAGTIAHEINQPLGAITNYVGGLLLGMELGNLDPSHFRDVLTNIQKQANRASQVIQRLRTFLRRDPPEMRQVDVHKLVKDTLDILRLETDRNDIQMRTRFSRKPARILGDVVQLQQVLVNLITNALEALTETNDRVRFVQIVVELNEQRVHIQIIDNGPGIPSSQLDKVFDPYFTSKPLGMGLGLSICREIVDAHDGHILAKRLDPIGTSIEMSFPICQT